MSRVSSISAYMQYFLYDRPSALQIGVTKLIRVTNGNQISDFSRAFLIFALTRGYSMRLTDVEGRLLFVFRIGLPRLKMGREGFNQREFHLNEGRQ